MSGKLDQSLEEITKTQKRARRNPPRRTAGRPVVAAPIGGIKKNTRVVRGAGAKAAPSRAAPANGESKIIVSNLVSSPDMSLDDKSC